MSNNTIQGLQGVQGVTCVQGPAGFRGLQGIQGPQGKPGYKGLQGVRGCQGLAGDDGTRGVQGVQGKIGLQGIRGCQGRIGMRGVQGVQGVQGKKGRRGAAGYMGYRGDNGEVGIQGLQGEGGYAVYFDGIRLNGYNTNLFVYNRFSDNFVSVNNSFPDLLQIKNGAVIKIWMNDEAYTKILETNTIPINSIEDGTAIPTNYPAYYSDNLNISELLLSTSSLNSVIEFTFNDGAWHYSGGLVGGGSGGDAIFTQGFEVTGMNLGQMTDGTPVAVGDRIETVVRKILTKVVDVKAVLPTMNFTVNKTLENIYEVGTELSFVVTSTLVDGYFESSNKSTYSDASFNEINHTSNGKLDAGCPVISTKYYLNNTLTVNTINITSIEEKTYNVQSKINYGNSTVVPKKNDGEDSSVRISNGWTSLATITFKGRYKVFYGTTEKILTNVERPYANVFTTKASLSSLASTYINPSGVTTVTDSIWSTDAKPSIVLVIPNFVSIENVSNAFGQSLANPYDKMKIQNTITYTVNSVTTTYNVYVMHNLFGIEYKNFRVTK